MPARSKPLSSNTALAIGVQLDCLTELLGDAVEALTEARGSLDRGEVNAAIERTGALEAQLAEAGALHQGIRVLHRRR